MGRALSFSLVAHAAFILSFLLLSATRHVLPVAPVVRPVRLVTYLEPGAAPRPRAASAARAPSLIPAPPAPAKTPAAAAVEPAPPPPAAVAVPRVVIPVPGPAAPAPAAASAAAPEESRPALGERLARRLASSGSAEPRAAETAPPRIAKLPPIDAEPGGAAAPVRAPAAGAPAGGGAGPVAAPTRGAVEPVGYFPHAWYLAYLKEEIFARWVPPSDFFQSRSPVALVSFRITRAGRLEALALKQGSGSARFDQSALAAVQGLVRLPALPEQYPEETLDVVIRFQNQR